MALPTPVGQQCDVLSFPAEGHFVVLGTAGSGKTTLAILRASMLSRGYCIDEEKTLLLTFNKALVTYLNSFAKNELKNVDVRNYHSFARGYLNSRGKLGRNDIVPNFKWDNQKLSMIKAAKDLVKQKYPKEVTFEREEVVFYEEIQWLQRMGIEDLGKYEKITRTGRIGTRINRDKRRYFFEVYQEYLKIREERGYKYDWDDMAYFVREEFNVDTRERMYKHIIIDEGQDFSPVMLQSLAAAVPKGESDVFWRCCSANIWSRVKLEICRA